MRRARAANAQRAWTSAATLPGFDPRMVPEVALGYFWSAARITGHGTSGFRIVEGNGNSTFDFVQATIATQPSILTENSCQQFRFADAGEANPSIVSTSGAVQAGWTTDTYVAGWFRLPDASGDISGPGNLFVHTPASAGQRRIAFTNLINTTDRQSILTSNDGTTQASNQYTSALAGGAWHWLEALVTVGTSSVLVADFVTATQVLTAVPPSPLFDGSALISLCSRAGAGLANVDRTDWATAYYARGIPSLFNRQRLMAHQAPIATSFM